MNDLTGEDIDALIEASHKTLLADKELLAPMQALLQACVAAARKRNLPPQMVIASILASCAVGMRAHCSRDEAMEAISMFHDLRVHMDERGVASRVRISGDPAPPSTGAKGSN